MTPVGYALTFLFSCVVMIASSCQNDDSPLGTGKIAKPADEEYGSLRIIVEDEQSRPVEGIRVVIMHETLREFMRGLSPF